MKTPKLLFSFFAFLFISTAALAHSNYFGYARDRGMVISVSPDKNPVKSGNTITFSGSIRVYNKDKDHKYSKNKYSLLEEFRKEGLDIVATFPSDTFDISNNLNFSSSSENEIRFSYTAQAVNASDLNQFSIKVYNNHHEREVLKKLALTRAKLERRLQALYQLKSKSRKEIWSEKARAYLDKQIHLLESISQKISAKLNSNEDLIAENTFAPQIDNLTSSSSRISSVMNKYRFVISSENGTVIEGMKTKITASVTNLRNSSEHDDEDHDEDDKNKVAQFSFNNQALFTSAAQKLEGGESISYSYTTGSLLTNAANDFSAALYISEKYKLNKRIGWVTQKIPVLNDATKPVWLAESSPNNSNGTLYVQALDYVNLKAFDEFGRIDKTTFVSNLSGTTTTGEEINQDLSQGFSALKLGDGWEYLFSKDINPLQEGLYKLESSVKDLASNESELNIIEFRIDRTPPKISLAVPLDALTNQMTFQVPISIEDLSPTTTKVYVNDELQLTTTVALFTATLNLTNEGANFVKVVSQDQAGNIFASDTKTIVRDTTPPVITFVSPKQDDSVDGFYFQVNLSTNEPVVSANLNSQTIAITGETQSLSVNYSTVLEGNTTLKAQATDKAGNLGEKQITVFAISRPLNQSLVGLYVDEPNNKVIVKGAVGATRPNYTVNISKGFFGSQSVTADAKGSFMISMDPATTYKISVYDHRKGVTVSYSYELDADNDVILSGTVRDTDDFPLINAKVSIVGTSMSTFTDSNGVFSFLKSNFPNKRVMGDQQLTIDGSSVILSAQATPRKFSKTSVSITIGVRQSNILQTPIYLAPTYLDGSATNIVAQSGGAVIDSHAPGVALSIPAGAAQFPNGNSEALISLQTIPSDRATVAAPQWAKPNTVVALEPSGTTFSQPVELTLPNVNEFPPTAELVVMLMNSKTGRWEIGGAAKVAADGQSITTKPNQGIRHFSLAYATIVGPNVRQIGAQDKPGADTLNGALSSQIEMPSVKILGSSFSPKLIYNSAWAKPSTLVTNLFDFANTKVSVTAPPQVGTKVEPYKVDLINCNWQILYETNTGAFDNIDNLPSYCSKDPATFYANAQYETKYTDVTSQIQPQRVEASLKTGDITTEKETFSNLPHMATVSFGIELKKNTQANEYFDSGVYPYQAHYDIYFKELVMGTYTTKYWNETTSAETTDPKQFEQLSPEKVFGRDLTGSIFVQNYKNSEAGTGWKVGGFQKIVNPNSDKIMIEEATGAVTSYSIKNTIQTIINVDSFGGDLKSGVALNAWPNIAVPATQNPNQILNLNYSSNSNHVSSGVLGTNYSISGNIKGFDFYNYTSTSNCRGEFYCSPRTGTLEYYKNVYVCWVESGYYYASNNGSGWFCPQITGIYRPDIGYICLWHEGRYQPDYHTVCDNNPMSSCSQHAANYEIKSKPASMLNFNGRVIGVDSNRHSVFDLSSNGSAKILGASESMKTFSNNYETTSEIKGSEINNFCNNISGLSCSNQSRTHSDVSQNYACGAAPSSMGESPYSQSDTILNGMQSLNTPMGIATSPWTDTIVIADYGFHKVRWLNVSTGETGVIAGNGQASDTGNGGQAIEASINHPKGLVYDSIGNLYISSDSGYIRKVDTNGNISIVAGDPVNGVLANESNADEVYFNKPYGLAIDQTNTYLYVADTGNNRVVRINLNSNQAVTVAGSGSVGFSGDGGAAVEASLNAPTHLGFDENQNLLIADSGNNRIRRVVFQNTAGGILAFSPTTKDHSVLQRVQDGTWVRTYRDGSRAYFNSLGYQTSAIDNVERTVFYQYDSKNRLTEIKTPTNESIQYVYSGDKLSRITDSANRTTEFSYTFSGHLKSVHYPDGTTKRFEYNDDGLMIAETDQKNSRREYQYNVYNRLEKVIQPDNTAVAINDSGSANLANFESANTQPKQYGKDPNKLNESITDPKGNQTLLAKDFQGYISTITDARGRTTTIKRDLDGRPIEVTDVDGSITQNTYDPIYGDVIKTTNVTLAITTETEYNIYGQVTKQKDPYSKISQKQYDSKKQLIKEIAPDGKFVTYEYNLLGLVVKKSVYSSSSELKNQITYDHNAKGQLIRQTDLNNKFSTYTYDLAGNVLTSTSNIEGSTQSTTTYEYDPMNRLTKVISPLGEVTQYSYSPTGELTQITDPKNKITVFEYDQKNQLIRKTDPLGQVHEMTYDANGNLLTEKDPANQIKQYFYNEVNKITQVNTADDQISYQYNIKDEVVQIANNTAVINYARDAKQRIIQEDVSGNNYPGHTIVIAYNKLDQRISLQSNFQNISYGYNPSTDQLVSINSSATGSYGFSYDSASRLVQISRPGSVTNYSFDIGSNLTRITHQKGSTEIGFHEYSYDLRNYITQKRSPASTLSYSYDTNGQLVAADKTENPSDSESFSYDALGNRLTYNGVTSTYDNSGQRIQDDGQFTYVFDANGNIIYKQNKSNGISYTFEYSALNQLKKATVTSTPLNGNVLKTIEYKYDPVGRRISRQVTDYEDSSKSKTQKYYYDGDNIIAELDEGNNLTASYTHSPLRPDDILGAKFTSAAVTNNLAAFAVYVYYLKDHLNTVNEVTNAVGDIVQKTEYSAFGMIRSVKDSTGNEVGFASAPVRSSFTYTGREFEPELGMYYYRARYYDPSVGRFLQQDPDPGKLALPMTFLSKYIYAGNAPIMFADSTGKSWLSDFFDNIFQAGHEFIAVLGAGIDKLLKNKIFQGILAIVLYAAAIIINPVVGLTSLAISVTKAGVQDGNIIENFFRDPLPDALAAFVGSSIATSIEVIADVNKYVGLFTPILKVAEFSPYIIIPKNFHGIIQSGCNKDHGSWYGGDICALR